MRETRQSGSEGGGPARKPGLPTPIAGRLLQARVRWLHLVVDEFKVEHEHGSAKGRTENPVYPSNQLEDILVARSLSEGLMALPDPIPKRRHGALAVSSDHQYHRSAYSSLRSIPKRYRPCPVGQTHSFLLDATQLGRFPPGDGSTHVSRRGELSPMGRSLAQFLGRHTPTLPHRGGAFRARYNMRPLAPM